MEKFLTRLQAYHAMIRFLEIYYEQTNSDDFGSLLGEMDFLQDGSTADPASWFNWIKSVQTIQNREEENLTILQSFKAMRRFLEIYHEQTSSLDTLSLLKDSQILQDESVADNTKWINWNKCVDAVLVETNNEHYKFLLKKSNN